MTNNVSHDVTNQLLKNRHYWRFFKYTALKTILQEIKFLYKNINKNELTQNHPKIKFGKNFVIKRMNHAIENISILFTVTFQANIILKKTIPFII